MWDIPGPGLEPVLPALAGGFLTSAPPGKSLQHIHKPHFVGDHINSQYQQSTLNSIPLYQKLFQVL